MAKALMSGVGATPACASSHFFRMALGTKDARLAVELAEKTGVIWQMGARLYEMIQAGIEQSDGDQNTSNYTTHLLDRRARA